MRQIEFLDKNGTFRLRQPEHYSGLYLPLAGEGGLKSCVTPGLGGDAKTDQNHFLLEPVSIENLHNNRNARNFWCRVENKGCWSACGVSAMQEAARFTDEEEESELEAGFMWQKLTRRSEKYGLQSEITSFVTVDGAMEVHLVEITNIVAEPVTITPVGCIPVYGRSADNLRDHRHVTSLLHRICTTAYGMEIRPVLSFDERGHQKNTVSYFVQGASGDGMAPEAFYPTVEEYIGEGGTFLIPEAVRKALPGKTAGYKAQGKEAAGAIRFAGATLAPGEKRSYVLLAGVTEKPEQIEAEVAKYRTEKQVKKALEELKAYWSGKVNVTFETGDPDADNYMKWICFQPILRRIYGCSFLPYHDYGKGGRGWRDLWQDCLALLLMNPSGVRRMIIDNYGGVRMDGTNATIIGSGQGEFIADRNNITRVWMDHAFWPFVTTKLYMDQTGDLDILLEKVPYFKDLQAKRGTAHDEKWNPACGNQQHTAEDMVYFGSILEHILLQNLCAFYDVGEHNEMRLHGADWNDAMDMAWENGESVAFTCAYAGNMKDIAGSLRALKKSTGISKLEVAEELQILLRRGDDLYEDAKLKRELLKQYTELCLHDITGKTVLLSLEDVAQNLEEKADWLMAHIRKNEWLQVGENGWFNGYYDNNRHQVEGKQNDTVRMMLTSQVFAIMSKTATKEQVSEICRSADRYLFEKQAGGYRLNTDFKEEKFDLGRMFGFAYGEKENGAVFSHMAVMYANALYKRDFAAEGYKVLQSLLDAAMDFTHSCMYPGLPEYFDPEGRGLYAYLTGAASWYMLTMITEVFGVKGQLGNLQIRPALMPPQFDEEGCAALQLVFEKRTFRICVHNPEGKTPSEGRILKATCDGRELTTDREKGVVLDKAFILSLEKQDCHQVDIVTG